MQKKRNLNTGLVIVPRWQLVLLRMHRFIWLAPALAAMCGGVAAGWLMLSAMLSWNALAAFLWLWCGVAALAYARHCVSRCLNL